MLSFSRREADHNKNFNEGSWHTFTAPEPKYQPLVAADGWRVTVNRCGKQLSTKGCYHIFLYKKRENT